MKAVVLVTFDDVKAGLRRYEGDSFTCTKARFDEINKKGTEQIGAPLVADAAKKG